MELSDMERLYVKQGIFKALGEQLSTKDPDSERGQADALYKQMYEATGAKSYDANVAGRKVGTVSVNVTKEVPATTEQVVTVTDEGEFVQWMDLNPDDVEAFVREHAREFCEWNIGRTGEVPDGAVVTEVDVPAQPPRVKSVSLRVDPLKVADVLRDKLPGSAPIVGLLESGE